MSKNPGHQPERFQVFTELTNGQGFTIKDSDHVFYYDKHGGWKDQYGNYYNEDGEADEEPDSNSQKSISQGSWDSIDDEYERQFAPSKDAQQVFQKQPIQSPIQLAIASNISELENYPKNDSLRVNFKVEGLQQNQQLPTEKNLVESYRKKVKGVINAFYDDNSQQTGYFVVSNVREATKLVRLEGQQVVDFPLLFEVETLEELHADPISQKEMIDRFPKFVEIIQNQKIYIVHLGNHSGFPDKKLYQQWVKRVNKAAPSAELIKMRVNQKGQKVPVIKIKVDEVAKAKQVLYNQQEVFVEEYKPIEKKEKEEEKREQDQVESKEQGKVDIKEEGKAETKEETKEEKAE